jgi:hypothetical protein
VSRRPVETTVKSGQVQNEQLAALPPKADVRSYGASSRTNGHGNAYAVERAADPLHRAREPSARREPPEPARCARGVSAIKKDWTGAKGYFFPPLWLPIEPDLDMLWDVLLGDEFDGRLWR